MESLKAVFEYLGFDINDSEKLLSGAVKIGSMYTGGIFRFDDTRFVVREMCYIDDFDDKIIVEYLYEVTDGKVELIRKSEI
jgi:hypothetical protein